ncbi:MAG: hypothetical protein NT013_16565 [Planctomycetia bacterium]|nr:hypothetical protein [Planctomycetia bacterium]
MSNTAFRVATCKFIDLVYRQSFLVQEAIKRDAGCAKLRNRRKELQASSKLTGEGYTLPSGRTGRLIRWFNAWDCDTGEFAKALATVNAQLCGTVLPERALIDALAVSHRAYLLAAREAFYDSRLEVDFAIRLEHFTNINKLKEVVGYIASADEDASTPTVVPNESTPILSQIPAWFERRASAHNWVI